MEVIEPIEEMHSVCRRLCAQGRRIRLVPTMGALHIGHASMIKRASTEPFEASNGSGGEVKKECEVSQVSGLLERANVSPSPADSGQQQIVSKEEEIFLLNSQKNSPLEKKNEKPDENNDNKLCVIVSIFINKKQFNEPSDYANYPSTLQADLELCRQLNVNYVFVPKSEQIYPNDRGEGDQACMVAPPERMARDLEGKFRPGHFQGMLTIVCKLFNIVRPHEAYFGEKDYQQLVLVSKMVEDLNMDVKIRPVETYRGPDQVPFSSRNSRLTEEQRLEAPLMYKILTDAKEALEMQCTRTVDSNNQDNRCLDINTILIGSLLATLCLNEAEQSEGHDDKRHIRVEYLELRCAKDCSEIHHDLNLNCFDCFEGCVRNRMKSGESHSVALEARLLTVVRLGTIRLLDNIKVQLN